LKIEQGLERNRFRKNTIQFKALPPTPITRRTPNTIVRYSCISASVLAKDGIVFFL
jgi:hypothetical protein